MNFIRNIYLRWQNGRIVKKLSVFILSEFFDAVQGVITKLQNSGRLKTPFHRGALQFEGTAFLIWYFQRTNIFPNEMYKPLLDGIHDQYFATLRKAGLKHNQVQIECDDLTLRYRTYDEEFGPDQALERVGVKFARFFSERSSLALDLSDALICVYLLEAVKPKFEKFKNLLAEDAGRAAI